MDSKKVTVEYDSPLFKRNWGWLLGLGILFVFLGFIGLGMVVGLTLISILFFGVLLAIAGVAQFIDVFRSRGWQGALWHAFIALLYLFAAAIVIYDPLLASAVITAMLAWVLIIIGILRIVMAFRLRGVKQWGWLLLAGLAAIVLGVLILLQWPWSALWVVGMFIAIEIMLNGWSYIMMAFALRQS